MSEDKQNRKSIKGCSKCIVPPPKKKKKKTNEKFWKRIGLNKNNMCKSQMERDRVSGGVSVPCRHAKPVANALWKPLRYHKKFEFGNKVTAWYEVLSVVGCHCIWPGYRMSINIRERRTSYCLIKCPYRH